MYIGQIYKGKYQGKVVALRERFELRDGRAGAGLFQYVNLCGLRDIYSKLQGDVFVQMQFQML